MLVNPITVEVKNSIVDILPVITIVIGTKKTIVSNPVTDTI